MYHDEKRSSVPLVMGLVAAAILFGWMFAGFVRAEAPACTGDRHYDGVACCPVTTTTLPDEDACKSCCPEPAPCPPVTCTCVDTHTTVQLERCPEYKYIDHIDRCRHLKDGRDVCPIKDHPRRVFIPRYESEQ